MPKAIILVGIPASGKSTWCSANTPPDAFVYSTDNIIEAIAVIMKSSYSEVFKAHVGDATKLANSRLRDAIADKKDIIFDRTNLTRASRKRLISQLPKFYKIECRVFAIPKSPDEWKEYNRRLSGRPGKQIPQFIIDNMIESYEEPYISEGFDEIYSYNIFGDIT